MPLHADLKKNKLRDTIITIIFEQLEKQLRKRGFVAIYCDSDWFLSVEKPEILEKFTKKT